MPSQPDWKPAAWLYGGGITLIFALRAICRGMLKSPEGRLKFGARLMAAGIYGAMVYARVITPTATEDVIRHFGEAPGGIPARVLIWLVVTALYIPFVLGARHFLVISMTASRLGYHGPFGMLLFYFRGPRIPELQRPRLITAILAIYGILLLITLGCLGAAWHDH